MLAPKWRECYVMSSIALQHLTSGIVFAFPSILTPAITDGSDDIHTTVEVASWIAGVFGLTAAIGFIFLPSLMQIYGRRFTNILCQVISVSGSVATAIAPNVTTLFMGRFLHGLVLANLCLTDIMTGEYCHPKRRGLYITMKVICVTLGVLFCHSLIYSVAWRQMAWLATVPAFLGGLTTLSWPESPPWLAYKGRFDECLSAFEWLRGNDVEAVKEVKELIAAQRELRRGQQQSKLLETLNAFHSKEFLRPFFVAAMLMILVEACGVYILGAYAMEILISVTGDESHAYYYTIGLDFTQLLATILLCFGVVTKFKRRSVLFSSGIVASTVLALVCLIDYLNEKKYLNARWLTPLLLVVYEFICQSGIMCISYIVKGEIIPLQYRGVGVTSVGIVTSITLLIALKFTATLIINLGTSGTFAVYLALLILSLVCLYYILPETKDRTLQDIETEFINLKLGPNDEESKEEIANKFMP